MMSPLKSSDFSSPPCLKIYLKCESPLQRDVTNSNNLLPPLMERISCYLRHSLQGNIVSHMIYTYIQQTVLATKSSNMKVPSQVSLIIALIDCLIFKQQKTIRVWVTHRNTFIDKKVSFAFFVFVLFYFYFILVVLFCCCCCWCFCVFFCSCFWVFGLSCSPLRHFPSVFYFFLPIAVTSYKHCVNISASYTSVLGVIGWVVGYEFT